MVQILPRHYITGIIIFTMFIVGGIALIDEFRAADSTFVDGDEYAQFNTTFNVYGDVTDEVGNLQSRVTTNSTATVLGSDGILGSLISSGWNTLKLLFSSFNFMDGVFNGLESFLGVPAWVGSLLILLVTVLLVFSIYSAIFQRDI